MVNTETAAIDWICGNCLRWWRSRWMYFWGWRAQACQTNGENIYHTSWAWYQFNPGGLVNAAETVKGLEFLVGKNQRSLAVTKFLVTLSLFWMFSANFWYFLVPCIPQDGTDWVIHSFTRLVPGLLRDMADRWSQHLLTCDVFLKEDQTQKSRFCPGIGTKFQIWRAWQKLSNSKS